MATTSASSFIASDWASGNTVTGSARSSAMMRPRSGHISTVSTVPISTSLTRPLAKLASACAENSRLKPAAGEHFDADLLKQPRQRRSVHADIVRVGDEPAHGGAEFGTHAAGERAHHQRGAGDDEPGVD